MKKSRGINVSVIIPTYNESRFIGKCLESLNKQSDGGFEVIVVDDGSTDNTQKQLNRLSSIKWNYDIKILSQSHIGPGKARNYAAHTARGRILVFIDADMTFDQDFIKYVTLPIKKNIANGTDSQAGTLANPENFWARCWNLGKFSAAKNYSKDYLTAITPNKRDYGGIFRAILASEFIRVGGFDTDGDYTDDSSLGRKLGYKAKIVNNAKFYHSNPDTLAEVWIRAKWIGSGKNFTGSIKLRIKNLIKFFPLVSVVKGFAVGLRYDYFQFVIFKVIYDTSVWLSVLSKG